MRKTKQTNNNKAHRRRGEKHKMKRIKQKQSTKNMK